MKILRPGAELTWKPPTYVRLALAEPETDCKKFGDDIFPIGFALLTILNRLLTERLADRLYFERFRPSLFLKSKVLDKKALELNETGPTPKFLGMILSDGSGFGSNAPYFVRITPGLLKSAAKAGRS